MVRPRRRYLRERDYANLRALWGATAQTIQRVDMMIRHGLMFVAVGIWFAWIAGLRFGVAMATRTCQPQPGAELMATVQMPMETRCEYAAGYGRKMFWRMAR